MTTTNALHYAYQASGDDLTRRLLMLQNAAFLTLFREALGKARQDARARIDQLEPAGTSAAKEGRGAIEEIFAEASHDKMAAARKALAYLQAGHEPESLIHAARTAGLPQGERRPRLQVQLGRAGGLLPRLALVSRAIPGRQHAPPARLGGQGQQPGQADPGGDGVVPGEDRVGDRPPGCADRLPVGTAQPAELYDARRFLVSI